MRTRTAYLGELLKSSFWFTPAATALAVVATLPVAKALERTPLSGLGWLESQTLEGVRMVLSSIATALMTVVAVLFSVTVVVLQQVSQQYSPRVIENFIRSIANQLVLGFYIGTFGYCVLLLGTIQGGAEKRAPVIAPSWAMVLAMACLALLIYYIHHLAKSIKSNTILAGIARQAVSAIDNLAADFSPGAEPAQLSAPASPCQSICATDNGYLQEIDLHLLRRALTGVPWRATIRVIPGDYIQREAVLMEVARGGHALQASEHEALRKAFIIDLTRTHTQDIRFGVRQMADVALRALSPGINDPSTGVEAVNEIGAVLLHYARSDCRQPVVQFAGGGRVQLREPDFGEFLDLCFNEIALAGRSHYRVQHAIQEVLKHCEGATPDADRRRAMAQKRRQLAAIAADAPGIDLYDGERSGAGKL